MRLKKADYEALARFRYTMRHFLRFSEQAAKAVGLTPQQHQALLQIEGYPGRKRVTVGELAERLQLRHHSAVGLVDRLQSLGLVTREASTHDRRRVYVMLTQVGATMLARLSAAHRDELRRIGPELLGLIRQLAP